jgi:hypothetical protein
MTTPKKRKASGGPSSANPSPAQKPFTSGSTPAAGPAIRSWITQREPTFQVDDLPRDKQGLHDMIKIYLDTLDMDDPRDPDDLHEEMVRYGSQVAEILCSGPRCTRRYSSATSIAVS